MSLSEQKTLSNKKKSTKTVKFSLAQPYSTFKPEITSQETQQLIEVLKGLNIVKEDKSKLKVEQNKSKNCNSDTQKKKWISFGFNSVIRCMKKSNADSVLITGEHKSDFIIGKVIVLGITHNINIKVLCVPDLSKICKDIFGFSCFTFCLLNQKKKNPYKRLHEWISKTTQNYPIPNLIIEQSKNFINKTRNVELKKKKKLKQKSNVHEKVDFEKLYLIKKKTNEREFIPAIISPIKKKKSTKKNKSKSVGDFISLDTEEDQKTTYVRDIQMPLNFENLLRPGTENDAQIYEIRNPPKRLKNININNEMFSLPKEKKVKYVNLTVHKTQGNPNKIKKLNDKKKKKKLNGKSKNV